MKKTALFLYAFAMLLFLQTSCESTIPIDKPYNEGINITPTPLTMEVNDGSFTITSKVVFISTDKDVNNVVAYFTHKIKNSTGIDLKTVTEKPSSDYIELILDSNLILNDEGYELVSSESGVEIKSKTPQGLFYGMQTLMQLLPAEIESPTRINDIAWSIPTITIRDEPRFGYRGHHIDVSRHFPSVEFLKKQIDLLAIFKINTFHWHFTDDQGWRVEIKKYPKLTEVGTMRTEGDGSTYGPFFYTQEEIKEVVAYAAERFVEVIPELELPGHAVAAAAAYPHLTCIGENLDVRNYWGVSSDVFCAGNDEVFTFLEDVIDELAPLFPSKYFHIGGDECIKNRWEKCPKCQARIKQENIKPQDGFNKEQMLQSYFVKRIHKVVVNHGRTMIGWDEITQGGLPDKAVVMSWNGERPGREMANKGYDVIMTPGDFAYLDKYQGESKVLPVTFGGLESEGSMLPLSKIYSYEPMPKGVEKDKEHHILGVQANSWHEYKYTEADMQHDMWPRLIALAEVAWSTKENKNYKDFEKRIDNQRVRLDMHNVNYYISRAERAGFPSSNQVAFIDSTTLEFKTTEPAKLVYTLDGSEPNLGSTEYIGPLTFTKTTTLKIRAVLVSEKMGETRIIHVEKQDYAPAMEKPTDAKSGLFAQYYKGNVLRTADLEGKEVAESEQVSNIYPSKCRIRGYTEVYDSLFYSSVYTGYLNIPKDDIYYFSTTEELWIDDKHVVTNEQDITSARRYSQNDASLALAQGYHKFKIVQLGATFGGFPTQWHDLSVSMRKNTDEDFAIITSDYFQ